MGSSLVARRNQNDRYRPAAASRAGRVGRAYSILPGMVLALVPRVDHGDAEVLEVPGTAQMTAFPSAHRARRRPARGAACPGCVARHRDDRGGRPARRRRSRAGCCIPGDHGGPLPETDVSQHAVADPVIASPGGTLRTVANRMASNALNPAAYSRRGRHHRRADQPCHTPRRPGPRRQRVPRHRAIIQVRVSSPRRRRRVREHIRHAEIASARRRELGHITGEPRPIDGLPGATACSEQLRDSGERVASRRQNARSCSTSASSDAAVPSRPLPLTPRSLCVVQDATEPFRTGRTPGLLRAGRPTRRGRALGRRPTPETFCRSARTRAPRRLPRARGRGRLAA
jgi:hypothetical protein